MWSHELSSIPEVLPALVLDFDMWKKSGTCPADASPHDWSTRYGTVTQRGCFCLAGEGLATLEDTQVNSGKRPRQPPGVY